MVHIYNLRTCEAEVYQLQVQGQAGYRTETQSQNKTRGQNSVNNRQRSKKWLELREEDTRETKSFCNILLKELKFLSCRQCDIIEELNRKTKGW